VSTWSDAGFEAIATIIAARTGLAFESYRYHDIERAARRAMASAAISEVRELASRLSSGELTCDEIIDDVTVGETYFFREPQHFAFVRDHVLPGKRSQAGTAFRVWSAGCASGEEAYSLAILLYEQQLLSNARVLGTDISRRALDKARAARFGSWSLRTLEPPFVARYFEGEGAMKRLAPFIHKPVVFRRLNLADDCYPSPETDTHTNDLIFCRNVLIYFDPKTIALVARRLFDALAPGGWLITGPSDPALSRQAPFEVTPTAAGLCYRRPVAAIAASALSAFAPRGGEWNESAIIAERTAPVGVRALPAEAPVEPPNTRKRGRAQAVRPDRASLRELARSHPDDLQLAALAGQSSASAGQSSANAGQSSANLIGPEAAERACADALERYPLCLELRYLRAALLSELSRHAEAADAARKVIYLDRTLAIAHYTLGTILRRLDDRRGAARAFRNAHRLCLQRPADEPIPLGDGITAAVLAELATTELLRLRRERGGSD
jgi:chemotaxis protein methyltransferase CheR